MDASGRGAPPKLQKIMGRAVLAPGARAFLQEGAIPLEGGLVRGRVRHAAESARRSGTRLRRPDAKILKTLREAEEAETLLDKTREDARLGRMSEPISFPATATAAEIAKTIGNDARLMPRFPVSQPKQDGSVKIRPVDDGTRAGINAATTPSEKLTVDGVDRVLAACRAFYDAHGYAPVLWKADVDAAYRRIPLAPGHAFAAWSAFLAKGRIWVSQHRALPFGAAGSVYGWDRVAAFIRHAARRLVRIPAGRYVDDYFAPDAPGSVAHGMAVFARLVRAILGPGSIASNKLEWGRMLVLLGISFAFSAQGIHCCPSEDKIYKWTAVIRRALAFGALEPGAASKLAGALSWASQSLFKRLGRAFLRPLFAQQHGSCPRIKGPLRIALTWWLEILESGVHEVAAWEAQLMDAAHLFADARSTPPRVAAVLFARGSAWYTDWEPDAAIMRLFYQRSDNQIMSLELLAIAVAMSSFRHLLPRTAIEIFSDNRGAEQAMARGSARQFDHTCLVHGVWAMAAELAASVWVHRVPSSANIADPPSREDYDLVRRIEAKFVEPVLDERFYAPQQWASLASAR